MTRRREQNHKTNAPKTIDDQVSALAEVTERLTRTLEKTRIAEYVDYLQHPWKLLWMNFLIGIARGLGSTLGLAVVLGIMIYLVQKLIMLNLPVLGDFIAQFLLTIQENMGYLNKRG